MYQEVLVWAPSRLAAVQRKIPSQTWMDVSFLCFGMNRAHLRRTAGARPLSRRVKSVTNGPLRPFTAPSIAATQFAKAAIHAARCVKSRRTEGALLQNRFRLMAAAQDAAATRLSVPVRVRTRWFSLTFRETLRPQVNAPMVCRTDQPGFDNRLSPWCRLSAANREAAWQSVSSRSST